MRTTKMELVLICARLEIGLSLSLKNLYIEMSYGDLFRSKDSV